MSLEDELSCPVCTDLFREPVLLSCGHSFCRQCVNDHWTSSRSRTCPVCVQSEPEEHLWERTTRGRRERENIHVRNARIL